MAIPMRKKKLLFLCMAAFALVLILFGWFSWGIFEGEKPSIKIEPLPDFLSGNREFKLTVSDRKRGLRSVEVSLIQEGRKTEILEKKFPFIGLFNSDGFRSFETGFSIDPKKRHLEQGGAHLEVRVRDYSRRRWGEGNLSLLQHEMVVDTNPPAIRAVSPTHRMNLGGSGLVVYTTSADTAESGVFVNDAFFPGFPVGDASYEWPHVCYFAVSHDTKVNSPFFLWAKDMAGNKTRSPLKHRIRKKRFRTRQINVTDPFLERILPNFSSYPFDPDASDIQRFVKVNRHLRKENALTFQGLRTETGPEKLWKGTWLRLKNAATMSRFADRRFYHYKGKKIDDQFHLGVDLASLANAEVPAANHGRVIYAEPLGIFGLTVVLDHGQGIASVYSHLRKTRVEPGLTVKKGDVIGLTGQTGLAGGDHLHFGMMVHGVFVNPIEWWDPHWIKDNVTRKLALLK
ncbi:MAG: M23 family metallopeptidase [Deltaproteobacteria bacterium]|nr:M23 family metallopeptidase [Deltaproteobacteria bacterium]